MSAGYIQLAAIGQQDTYLTGKPDVTYFSGVYKRHTPFVLEAYDIPFKDQQVNYDAINICRIPPKGDLIRGLTLKTKLPALSNPGDSWTWPSPSKITYLPNFTVKPLDNYTPTKISAVPYASVSYYGTTNASTWLVAPLSYFVRIDFVNFKFVFSNCTSVEVDSTFGVFWGFDPKLGTGTASGTTVYTVTGTRTADFTFEQSGWRNVAGIVDPKTGLFLQPSVSALVSQAGSFVDLSTWTNYYSKPVAFNITSSPAGLLSFGGNGLYLMRMVILLDAGSVASISYGTIPAGSTLPATPSFIYTYTCRVSPDPSMPITFPINVTNSALNYYFYISSSTAGASILPTSWISANPLEESYKFKNSTTVLSSRNSRLQFSSNIDAPSNQTLSLATDSSFRFSGATGLYLVTGSIGLVSPSAGQYVANVSISNTSSISNTLFVYDMSPQGRDPTFVFSMPLTVGSATLPYAFNIGLTTGSTATIDANTFVAFHLFGLLTGIPGQVLPYNGLLFSSTGTSTNLYPSIDFSDDWSKSGGTAGSIITTTSKTNLSFANPGIYMITATIAGTTAISQVTFGSTTYNVGVGLLPPYTFTVPYNAITAGATAGISFTTTVSPQTLNSNSFISVFPIASNTVVDYTYRYNDSVATWAIKSAELKIGGQTIQTLSGEFIELWNDLYVPYENQAGLTLLTGKNDTTDIYAARTYYTNLPFYFYGNPELSIPIVALDRQDVEVWVTFRKFSELTSVSIGNPTLDATVLVEYVYLSDPEINWFKGHRLDYLITQCQYQNFDLLSNFKSSIFQLKLLNPVRELFFVVQPTTNSNYDYTGNGLQSLALTINGAEVFTGDTTDATFLGSLQPFIHYPNYPSRRFYMYPFTTEPGSSKPYGHINMSRIRQILVELKTDQSVSPKQLRVVAVNYNVLRIENGIAGIMFNAGTQSV